MKNIGTAFQIIYKDDFNKTHITVVKSILELNFFRQNYHVVDYDTILLPD